MDTETTSTPAAVADERPAGAPLTLMPADRRARNRIFILAPSR